MFKTKILIISLLVSVLWSTNGQQKQAKNNVQFQTSPRETLLLMKSVADWQLNKGIQRGVTYWGNAAFFAGISELASWVNNDHYYNELQRYFDEVEWAIGSRKLHADDFAILQVYCEMYEVFGKKEYYSDGKKAADELINQPLAESLDVNLSDHNKVWNWCDAMFMAPPALSRLYTATGDMKYLDGMDRLYWHTMDYLYNPDDKLVFRDSKYFDDKSPNGEHIYWSRGNGWVMGGLVRILQDMPKDYPSRPKYETLFKEISSRLISLLTPDGTWHTNLLDPDDYPDKELSGTTFFVYALAYGVNQGLLDQETYLPIIMKAWKACTDGVHDNGMIGHIQPIGASPGYVTYDFTESYGAGSFILAGSEVLRLMIDLEPKIASVVVKNPNPFNRLYETVELDWNLLKKKGAKDGQIKIVDLITGVEIPSQITKDTDGKASRLIFQVKLASGAEKHFIIKKGKPALYNAKAYGRIVPERYDDFAWENNRMAYRIYGQALIPIDGPSGGIDVWKKRTNALVIDKWYKNGKYHKDHGEGNDSYKVGPSMGAGGISLLDDGKLVLHENYKTAKIIENGPLRFSAIFTFEDQTIGNKKVALTKKLTLDANTYLNKWEVLFKSDTPELPLAVGIVKRNKPGGNVVMDEKNGVLSYYEPENTKDNGLTGRDAGNGRTGIGVLMPKQALMEAMDNHYVAKDMAISGIPFVYYSGASWDKAQYKWRRLPIPITNEAWIDYLYQTQKQHENPLAVTLRFY